MTEIKCSVCVNTNNQTVVNVAENYNMCESCIQEDFERKRDKMYRLEKLLEYIIECGL